jgi:hypothetical protein
VFTACRDQLGCPLHCSTGCWLVADGLLTHRTVQRTTKLVTTLHCQQKIRKHATKLLHSFGAALIAKLDSTVPISRKMGFTVKTKWELSSETHSITLRRKTRHMDGCWINHCISLGLSYTSFPRNGFTVMKQWTSEISLMVLYYFYIILCCMIKDQGFNIYSCTRWWLSQAETCSSILAQP